MLARRILTCCLLALLLPIANTALPLEVPEKPKGRVSDYAGLLTEGQIAALDEKLRSYEEETTNQIAVVVFKSLEGESLEDFSIRLAEKWKIGTRLRDNGVILLVFLEDRKVRIEVGYGLEGALTDATASSIIRNVIAPRFRRGDYYGGIEAGIEKIIEATRGQYKAEPAGGGQTGELPATLLPVAIFLLIWLLFAAGTRRSRRRYYVFGPGGWTSGTSWRSDLPFGSFSGVGGSLGDEGFSGGGGRFGGGGASGSW